MLIHKLLDEPKSLNKKSIEKIFKSHNKAMTYLTHFHPEYRTDHFSLYKFFKNYFEYGLPMFVGDILDSKRKIVSYKNDPIEWILGFDDKKIELCLTYLYMKKYSEICFKTIAPENSHINLLIEKMIFAYKNEDIFLLQNEINNQIKNNEILFKEIISYRGLLFNKIIDSKYEYDKYLKNRDLNVLLKICYNLFFGNTKLSKNQNNYNSKNIDIIIKEKLGE